MTDDDLLEPDDSRIVRAPDEPENQFSYLEIHSQDPNKNREDNWSVERGEEDEIEDMGVAIYIIEHNLPINKRYRVVKYTVSHETIHEKEP